MATIIIGADVCPIGGNLACFKAGDAQNLFNDLLGEFHQSDLSIANLECPFIENPSPILKTGPTFGAGSDCINSIKNARIDVLGLANNHIMDHGAAGLSNTMRVCAEAGIATVGAGRTLAEARQILVRHVGPIRIGILAMAEREFSIASNGSPGANPCDLVDFVRNVNTHRYAFDYLIVLLHGSAEFHVPTPRIKDTCRFMIEMGANAVIVQHPHCLGGYEEYRGGHIVYGQGALIMDEAIYRDVTTFHEGFLVKLNLAQDLSSTMEIVPFTQSMPAPGARRMPPDQEQKFRQRLEERSRDIMDPRFVEAEWRTFCQKRRHGYLSSILGHGRILRRFNVGGLMEKLYGRRLLGVRNLVCCETHREALETIFNEIRNS